MKKLEGIFVVMLSPFKDGLVDEAAMRYMVDHFVDQGAHGLVVLGSNGEFPLLSDEEKHKLIDTTVSQVNGRVPVIAGTGYMGTDQTVAMTKYARNAGADAAMIALPIYYQLDFEDVKRHYQRVADEAGLPIVYYNIPDATGLKLSPAQIAELAEIDQVIGVKETIPDVDEMIELVNLMEGKPFSVLSGTVLNLAAIVDSGVCGAIGVLPNLATKQSVAFYNALKDKDEDKKNEMMSYLFKFMPVMTSSVTPHAMLKEGLRQQGIPIEPTVKDPLPPLTDEQKELVSQVLADANAGS